MALNSHLSTMRLPILGLVSAVLAACGGADRQDAANTASTSQSKAAAAVSAITSGSVYKLINPNSKLALDVAGCGTGNGTNVQVWADGVGVCNNGDGQKWTPVLNADGTYKLINPSSKLVLDVAGCGSTDGTNVQLWADGVGVCNGGAGQKWRIVANSDGTYTLVNPNNNRALDVAGSGTANGVNVHTWTQNNSGAQKWQFVSLSEVVTPPPLPPDTAAVYFYAGTNKWTSTDIVYAINGVWTGASMTEEACPDWFKKSVSLGTATSMLAAFNNGTIWDNNTGANYTIVPGVSTVVDGKVVSKVASPCPFIAPPPPPAAIPAERAPLGVIYTSGQSTFTLWSPDTANVALNLGGKIYPMTKSSNAKGFNDVYSVVVPGNHHLKTYNFQVNGVTTRDPYGVMVQPGTDNNVVLDMSKTALPGGWAPTPPLANRIDSVIYETHIRDFTIDASSGVPAAQRGTYVGMTAAGTTVNGAASAPKTGIDHLADLGVTHVQLLPVYDFGTCGPAEVAANPGCYNWGYDPVNFNVPEERYSLKPNDPVERVREFKAMVDGLHKRGIRVVMDVVYNHTYNKDVLGKITPKYYNRIDMSGTGNSLDASQPMVARMMRDSLEYWVREYNIDGFRVDLMGVFDTKVVGEWGTYLNTTFPGRNLMLYGEPWTGGVADPLENQHLRYGSVGTIENAHVGVFNGTFRDALKNSKNDAGGTGGFIFNQDTPDGNFGVYNPASTWPSGLGKGAISLGVKASPLVNLPATQQANVWTPMFTSAPEQSMNYADIHDNLCLADKVTAWAAASWQHRLLGPYPGVCAEHCVDFARHPHSSRWQRDAAQQGRRRQQLHLARQRQFVQMESAEHQPTNSQLCEKPDRAAPRAPRLSFQHLGRC
jgi:hypothetical protein